MMLQMTSSAEWDLLSVGFNHNPIDLRDFRIEFAHFSHVMHFYELIGSALGTGEVSQ